MTLAGPVTPVDSAGQALSASSRSIVMSIRSSAALISLASVVVIAGPHFAAPLAHLPDEGKTFVAESPRTLGDSAPENKTNGLAAELLAESPGLLENVTAEQSLRTGKVQAEVEHS